MDQLSDCSVLIVGAGPTGLVLACELARQGIRVRVIDQKSGPTAESRALGVQARTLELLERLDLTEAIVSEGKTIRALNLYAGGAPLGRIEAPALDTRYPFILSFPQSETERLLIERLRQHGVEVEWQTGLTALRPRAGGAIATIAYHDALPSESSHDWVVGCDGAHSAVRRNLGISFAGERFPEWFALADVELDWALPHNEAHVFFAPDGPLPVLPLPGANVYRLIAPLPHASLDQAPDVSLERFQQLWAERAKVPVTVGKTIWLSSFLISRRIVDTYRSQRVLLAGDAAHIHSPVGGQGMNTGIQDAFNLAWKLALVIKGMAADELLDTYEAERRPIAERTLHGTRLATLLVASRNWLAQKLRNAIVSRLAPRPAFRERVFRTVSNLAVNYRGGPLANEPSRCWFCRRSAQDSAPRAGDRAPDSPLAAADGRALRLHQLLHGTHLALIEFAGLAPLGPGDRDALQRLVARFSSTVSLHRIATDGQFAVPHAGDSFFFDPDGAAHRRYGATEPLICLIRPDGYLAWRGGAAEVSGLDTYLSRWFVADASRATSV